jgi:hypothetical protein
MLLSEDCDIEYIQSLASKNNVNFSLLLERKTLAEKNSLFHIKTED